MVMMCGQSLGRVVRTSALPCPPCTAAADVGGAVLLCTRTSASMAMLCNDVIPRFQSLYEMQQHERVGYL